MLMSRKPEDKEYKQLKTIEEQAKRCSEIVTRLLRFSQEGTGARVPVDVREVVREALALFDTKLAEDKIEIAGAEPRAGPAQSDRPQGRVARRLLARSLQRPQRDARRRHADDPHLDGERRRWR